MSEDLDHTQTRSDSVSISVILCTHNPRMDLLDWALSCLERQSLPKGRFEVVLVDNDSTPRLDRKHLEAYRLPLRVIEEPRQGLSFARVAGIKASLAPLLVFVDDDNCLEEEYLENAYRIAEANPEIGLYGGISMARMEKPISKWKEATLGHLGVRHYGPEPITSTEPRWGKWEPIGAGMVTRREVAESFATFIESNTAAARLGRSGQSLLSGEDSLFARLANRLGYACSYQPSLTLDHFIPEGRLRPQYLFRLLNGHGRSYVRLERVLGKKVPSMSGAEAALFLVRRMLYRVVKEGRIGLIHWAWDLGFVMESRATTERVVDE